MLADPRAKPEKKSMNTRLTIRIAAWHIGNDDRLIAIVISRSDAVLGNIAMMGVLSIYRNHRRGLVCFFSFLLDSNALGDRISKSQAFG